MIATLAGVQDFVSFVLVVALCDRVHGRFTWSHFLSSKFESPPHILEACHDSSCYPHEFVSSKVISSFLFSLQTVHVACPVLFWKPHSFVLNGLYHFSGDLCCCECLSNFLWQGIERECVWMTYFLSNFRFEVASVCCV